MPPRVLLLLEIKRYVFAALTPAYRFLSLSARYLWQKHSSFRPLVAFATILNICRFAAFLLPFKALMLLLAPERHFVIGGHDISAKQLAAVVLATAVVFFAGQWFARSRYEVHIARLFGEDSELDDRLNSPARNRANELLFRTTVNFVSSQIFIAALVCATILAVRWSALFIMPFAAVYAGALSRFLSDNKKNSHDLSWHNNIFSFTTMIAVLIFLAVLVSMNEIGPLHGLFVFIACRQLMVSFGEFSQTLMRYREPVVPAFLRASADERLAPRQRAKTNSAPFLQTQERNSWLLRQLASVSEQPLEIDKVAWIQSGNRALHAFAVTVKSQAGEGSTFIVNVFAQADQASANLERFLVQGFGANPLCLPFLGTHMDAGYRVLIYANDGRPADENGPFPRKAPEILKALWSFPADKLEMVAAAPVDFLDAIDASALEKLCSVSSSSAQQATLQKFTEDLITAKGIVNKLPKTLMNPLINRSTVLEGRDGHPRLLTWSLATVQPLGCQLHYLPSVDDDALREILQQLAAIRPECALATVAELRLASALFSLERNLYRNSLLNAVSDAQAAAKALGQVLSAGSAQ